MRPIARIHAHRPLLGETYRHRPTDRPVLLLEHQLNGQGRTGRLVAQFTDVRFEQPLLVTEDELVLSTPSSARPLKAATARRNRP